MDKMYHEIQNCAYCKEHGIEMSRPKLGRPPKGGRKTLKEEYQDNTDRIGSVIMMPGIAGNFSG